jgi:hypothetical protein
MPAAFLRPPAHAPRVFKREIDETPATKSSRLCDAVHATVQGIAGRPLGARRGSGKVPLNMPVRRY